MPGSLKTDAVVLRSMRYGEADRILHVYTPDRGRLSAIAKGVRRAKSRFGGRLEPYFRLRLVLYQGRSDLLTVTSAETLDGIRGCASTAARSTGRRGRATPSGGCSARASRTAASTTCSANQLALIDADPARATRGNALAFRLKLLLAAGFAPQLAACAGCGESEHLVGFSGAAGGVVCTACEASAFALGQDAHDFLVGALGRPLAEAPDARRAPWRRRSGRSSRRSSTTRTCDCARSERPTSQCGRTLLHRNCAFGRRSPAQGVRMDGVSASVTDRAFEARIRAWEEDALAPGAARSYPGDRERPEDDCGLRTPFQRDRDRIVHCKAFRRLKHKTQVFVAPEGDHYRTRLTHTLETTQISRTVARALRLNEDLTEAIGLGHDLGHPPFGHIGEDVLDRAGRERFGRGFRHNEHSLRVVEVIERLNLTAPVRDGILRHSSGAGEPATLEGKIVRLVDRIAYINHDIDDALRAGVIAPRRPARARRSRCSARRARNGSTRSCTTWSSTRGRRRTSSRARPSAPRCCGCATFMFDRVYLGPTARAEHAKIERVLQRAVRLVLRAPGRAARGRRRGVGRRSRDRLSRRDDRPLRAPRLERPLRAAGPRELMPRYTDDSRERVRDAVDFVELVGARTELKPAGPRRHDRAVPVPRRAHAVVRHRPGREALPLLRLRGGRRRLQVRDGDRGARLRRRARGARRAGRDRARARGRGPARRRAARAPRAAAGAARADRRLLRARAVGVGRGGAGARVPGRARAGGGRAARVPRRLLAARVGPRDRRRRAAPATPRRSCSPPGLALQRREGPGLLDRFRGRIMFPLADPKGHVLGFGARALSPTTSPSTSTRRSPSSSTRARWSTAPTSPARPPRGRAGSCSSRATRT